MRLKLLLPFEFICILILCCQLSFCPTSHRPLSLCLFLSFFSCVSFICKILFFVTGPKQRLRPGEMYLEVRTSSIENKQSTTNKQSNKKKNTKIPKMSQDSASSFSVFDFLFSVFFFFFLNFFLVFFSSILSLFFFFETNKFFGVSASFITDSGMELHPTKPAYPPKPPKQNQTLPKNRQRNEFQSTTDGFELY